MQIHNLMKFTHNLRLLRNHMNFNHYLARIKVKIV